MTAPRAQNRVANARASPQPSLFLPLTPSSHPLFVLITTHFLSHLNSTDAIMPDVNAFSLMDSNHLKFSISDQILQVPEK